MIVVDDASPVPPEVRDPAVLVVRHERNRGPAAARNTGLRLVATPFVAFLDTDARPPPGWDQALAGHFADAELAVVAPRVVGAPGPSWRHAYEQVRCPLDMGPHSGLVRPRTPLAYVPSAAWVARTEALTAVGGFDETRRTGEDVDLVWRLERAGWRVRYDASVVVEHEPRAARRDWLRQRYWYGRSAAPLWESHPDALRHLEVHPAAALPWVAAATLGPAAAAPAAMVALAWGRRTLPLPAAVAGAAARDALWRTGEQLATYTRRVAAPLLACAAPWSRAARRALAWSVFAYALDWRRERPRLSLPAYAAFRAADDLAYAAGAWSGALRLRRLAPLAPHLARRPAPR